MDENIRFNIHFRFWAFLILMASNTRLCISYLLPERHFQTTAEFWAVKPQRALCRGHRRKQRREKETMLAVVSLNLIEPLPRVSFWMNLNFPVETNHRTSMSGQIKARRSIITRLLLSVSWASTSDREHSQQGVPAMSQGSCRKTHLTLRRRSLPTKGSRFSSVPNPEY